MGDLNQQQLAQLLALYQEANATSSARLEDLNARLDALTKDLANLKADVEAIGNGNQNQGWKGKAVAAGSRSETGGNSMIPKHIKLDFPRFCGQEDPWGWMNTCEHYFQHQHTQEEEEIGLASFHLEGIAQRETGVMGDPKQKQLEILALYKEERATNLARLEDLNARVNAVMNELANLEAYVEAIENGNQNRGWKGKVVTAKKETCNEGFKNGGRVQGRWKSPRSGNPSLNSSLVKKILKGKGLRKVEKSMVEPILEPKPCKNYNKA